MADNQPDLSNVYQALRNADAAGDTAAAQKLANYIRSVQGNSAASAPSGSGATTAARTAASGPTQVQGQPDSGSGANQAPKGILQRVGEIGGQAATGAVLGAVTPELLAGAAAVTAPIPVVGEVVGALAIGAEVSRWARLAMSAYGALGGAIGETAGQATEALGGSKGLADTARFVGGLASPAGPETAGAIAHGIGLPAVIRAVKNVLGGGADAEAVRAAKSVLAGTQEVGPPQHLLNAVLAKGAAEDIKAAGQQASKVYQGAVEKAAEIAKTDAVGADKLIQQGKQQAAQIQSDAAKRAAELGKLSGGRSATAEGILKQADPALHRIGQPQELSDIGKTIQQAVVEKHGQALQARSEAYNTLRNQRDEIVKQKEAAGLSIDSTPAFQSLQKEVQSALKPTSKGFTQVVDPGVRRSFEALNEALTRDAVNGAPGKTSFNALDQVRRRLGDVIANRAVEGYSAIGKDIAGKMYAKITKAQQEFVGPVQQEMQTGYHEASQGMQKFGAGAGKKATAVDRMNPERLAADPQTLPGHFFNSQQSVQDFKELVQNPQLVKDAAHNYAAKSIQGMSSKQVNAWAMKNSDWIREVPGLKESLGNYATQLQKIERVSQKAAESSMALRKQAVAAREGGELAAQRELQVSRESARAAAEGSVKTQERVLKEGEKSAAEVKQTLSNPPKELQRILQSGEGPEAVRNLLMTAKPEQTRLAARYLGQSPEGRQALDQSVRQILSTMSEKTLNQQWSERILPMLQEGKMLGPERLAALKADVQRVQRAYSGPEKLKWFQKHVLGAIGTAGGGYVGGTGN